MTDNWLLKRSHTVKLCRIKRIFRPISRKLHAVALLFVCAFFSAQCVQAKNIKDTGPTPTEAAALYKHVCVDSTSYKARTEKINKLEKLDFAMVRDYTKNKLFESKTSRIRMIVGPDSCGLFWLKVAPKKKYDEAFDSLGLGAVEIYAPTSGPRTYLYKQTWP